MATKLVWAQALVSGSPGKTKLQKKINVGCTAADIDVWWTMKRALYLIFAVIGLVATQLHAQTTLPVNVRNAGAFTCQQFQPIVRSEQRQLEKTAFLQWAAGYATAAARSNSLIDVFPIGDTWELIVMVNLICSEDNSITFEAALLDAIGRLRPFWIRQKTKILELNDPIGRTVQFYEEATLPLQKALNSAGAKINADGAYGNQTAQAIRAINSSRGAVNWLTPDGELLYLITRKNT